MKHTKLFLQTSTVLCCGILATTASASGFRVPEISTAGTALSNALVANPDLPGALPYNPAAMAFHEQGQLLVGVTLVQPDISVKFDSGNSSKSTGKGTIPIPNVFASARINNAWTAGVAINAPFGLETNWQAGTFGTFADVATTVGNPAVAGLEPEHSKIEMVNTNPNVAYQFGNTSIALGINRYHVRKLIFNTQAVSITGNGQDYGWNIGLLHAQNNWSVGLSYRSSVKIKLDGTVGVTGLPATDRAAKAEVEFPSLLQVGARYKVNNKLAVEFDVEQTGWSSFDTITIEHSNAAPITNTINSKNNWSDSMAYRLGATYELSSTNQLQFGYAYDETPSDDNFFSARVPGNDRQMISMGLAHKQADWTIEFAYLYMQADDRKIASSTSFQTGVIGGDTDANGTDAFNGTYKLSAHLFSLGVSTQF